MCSKQGGNNGNADWLSDSMCLCHGAKGDPSSEGLFINDVIQVGGGGLQFGDTCMMVKVKQATLCDRGGGGSKNIQNCVTSLMDKPFLPGHNVCFKNTILKHLN